MDLGLKRKRAVVIGASRGIGRAVAIYLANEGCDVAICARSAAGVAEVENILSSKGVRACGVALDITDLRAAADWARDLPSLLGGLDILVWNVSAQSREWNRSFQTDIVACVNIVDTLVPVLERSECPSIVGIASQAALLAVPNYKAYSAMKAAFVSYLTALARDLADRGIRVNAISPGEIDDPEGIWGRIRQERPERYAEALRKNIRGSLGTPEEVARVVVFVASPAASLVSGSNILVDGMSRDFVQF
jgi:3-oxoacyl-[acyl-carrier protein] reductase